MIMIRNDILIVIELNTYRSEDLAFPMSDVITNNFSFYDLFTLSLYTNSLDDVYDLSNLRF